MGAYFAYGTYNGAAYYRRYDGAYYLWYGHVGNGAAFYYMIGSGPPTNLVSAYALWAQNIQRPTPNVIYIPGTYQSIYNASGYAAI